MLRKPPPPVWLCAGAFAALLIAPVASGIVYGEGSIVMAVRLAVAIGAVALSASYMPWMWVRPLIVWGGGLFALSNVAAGLAGTMAWLPDGVIESNPRYQDWLGGLVDAQSLPVLSGLPGRQTLGGSLALVVVAQVALLWHERRLGFAQPSFWFGPALGSLALAWTMSRTGVLALLAGLFAVFVPWGVIPARARQSALALGSLLLMIAPLVGLIAYEPGLQNTYQWRMQVWLDLLRDPRFFAPFGRGPNEGLVLGAAHTHNVVIELAALGGILGLAALLGFVWIMAGFAIRSMESLGRALLGSFVAFSVIAGWEMPISLRYPSLTIELVLLAIIAGCTVGATSQSGSLPNRGEEANRLGAERPVGPLGRIHTQRVDVLGQEP
jgi:hypothetical protein